MRTNLVRTKEQIINNMNTLDSYLASTGTPECGFAKDLIRKGRCFVYKIIDLKNSDLTDSSGTNGK